MCVGSPALLLEQGEAAFEANAADSAGDARGFSGEAVADAFLRQS